MASRRGVWAAAALALLLGAECTHAQTLSQTTEEALHEMSQRAGVIFTGQVVAVRRHDGASGATGVIEIDFALEDAVRGVSGNRYTLHEWAGLWPAGDEPFRVGQRFLMLLHAQGASGFNSPVGGMDGAIPIGGARQSPGPQAVPSRPTASADTVVAGTTPQADGRRMDLRWIAASVTKPTLYRPEPGSRSVARPISVFSLHADSVIAGDAYTGESESVSISQTAYVPVSAAATPAPASQAEAYTKVLGLLRNWEKDDHARR